MLENITIKRGKGVYLILDFTVADTLEVDGVKFAHHIDDDGFEYVIVDGDWLDEIPVKDGRYLVDGPLPCFRFRKWVVEVVSIKTTHYHYCQTAEGWVKNR